MNKPVIGYEGRYIIDEYGNIFSIKKNRRIKPHLDKDGYVIVVLCIGYDTKKYKLHRLVAKHFLEDFEESRQINHKDFNKSNNHYSNLEKSSHFHNQNHKWTKNGKKRYGVFKHKDKWRSWLNIGSRKRIELGVSNDKEFLYERFYQAYLKFHGVPPWDKTVFE